MALVMGAGSSTIGSAWRDLDDAPISIEPPDDLDPEPADDESETIHEAC
jgi:hypothetical protein